MSASRRGADAAFRAVSGEWLIESARARHAYQWNWLGRPIIQLPQDIVAVQEILWKVRPRLVVETGVAHGGSLVLSASVLELIGGDGLVVGVDIEIRAPNRVEIEKHPLARRIRLIEGSSVDPAVAAQVRRLADGRGPVVVILDSNHTHEHVRRELDLYAPLVRLGSYLIVFDTVIEDLPADQFPDRPWGRGNSPRTALREFLRECDRFAIDREIEAKIAVSAAPDGYLRCVKE